MEMTVLDTNVLIEILKNNPQTIKQVESLPPRRVKCPDNNS